LRRAPLTAVTIVVTVGLGLGLVAVVFTIMNAVLFRVDAVRNPHELFAVERQVSANSEFAGFTRAEYDALIAETGVFSAAFATRSGQASIEGRTMEGPLVTGNFFEIVGASAARGRTLVPSDDDPGQAAVIVLSHRTWERHFASDPGILERTIRVNGTPFQVIGVMPEDFRGLTWIAPEFWAPLAAPAFPLSGEARSSDVRIIGRLTPGVSRDAALAELRVWDARQVAERAPDEPVASLILSPRTGAVPMSVGSLVLFMPLFFAFGLILMIGCANVANLLLARGVARQREIGIRLALGASRRRVVWQLLIESLLLALVAAVLAFVISRVALEVVVYTITSSFPPDIGHLNIAVPPADWRVVLFLVAGAIVSTLFFALAPALRATRLDLTRAMHGEVLGVGRPGRARDALVAVQVTASVLLLICAAIFLRGASEAAAVEPGIRTTGIVSVTVVDEEKREAILNAVRNEPVVATVAASFPGFLGGFGWIPGLADGATGKLPVTYQFVSPEYFGVYGIDLVRGRGFADNERNTNAGVAIVSASTAQELWPDSDPLGQVVRVEPDPARVPGGAAPPAETPEANSNQQLARTAVVVGVARDVAGFRLGAMRLGGAGIYMPISADMALTALTMAVRGDSESARQTLVDRLAAIDPSAGEVSTMETIARTEVYLLSIPLWLTLVLGALALVLTLSGLFSVLSYIVEQRRREIGVRMALGASRRSIGALVLAQTARPVGIGMVIGGVLTVGLAAALLATPLAEQIGEETVRLFDPVAYGASLLFIFAACIGAALVPTLRAGRVDPVVALRQD
jgi:predicted permease